MNPKWKEDEARMKVNTKMQMNEWMKYVWDCGFLVFAKLNECKILKYHVK